MRLLFVERDTMGMGSGESCFLLLFISLFAFDLGPELTRCFCFDLVPAFSGKSILSQQKIHSELVL